MGTHKRIVIENGEAVKEEQYNTEGQFDRAWHSPVLLKTPVMAASARGKTIDSIKYSNDSRQAIISFTDQTFLMFSCHGDDANLDEYPCALDLADWGKGALVSSGLIKPSAYDEHIKQRRDCLRAREYEVFLHLKRQFEKGI